MRSSVTGGVETRACRATRSHAWESRRGASMQARRLAAAAAQSGWHERARGSRGLEPLSSEKFRGSWQRRTAAGGAGVATERAAAPPLHRPIGSKLARLSGAITRPGASRNSPYSSRRDPDHMLHASSTPPRGSPVILAPPPTCIPDTCRAVIQGRHVPPKPSRAPLRDPSGRSAARACVVHSPRITLRFTRDRAVLAASWKRLACREVQATM